MFRPSLTIENRPIDLNQSVSLLGTPKFIQKTIEGTNITLYDKNKNIIGVTNIVIPPTGLQNIIYNDTLYSLVDGIYIESEVYHHVEQLS